MDLVQVLVLWRVFEVALHHVDKVIMNILGLPTCVTVDTTQMDLGQVLVILRMVGVTLLHVEKVVMK